MTFGLEPRAAIDGRALHVAQILLLCRHMLVPVNVIYLAAGEANLSARANSGRLSVDATNVVISGSPGVSLPLTSLRAVELRRSQLGHMIHLRHQEGSLLLGVYRINLWGYFVVLNFVATRRLAERLGELLASRTGPDASQLGS